MTNDPESPRHPIRVVAHRTGLTPATIRAWERRYGAVEPARSDGRQRLYSDTDIERLNTLRALTDMGRSISSVAALPPEVARALLSEDLEAAATPPSATPSETEDTWVEDAFRHMSSMDTEALERTLWRAFLALGAKQFLGSVAAPLLGQIGAEWAAGRVSPAQEHLGSGILERILSWMNDPAKANQSGPTVVVATLPGEQHALGARLAAAAASVEGWRPVYLGAALPSEEIASAAARVGADTVAISAVRTEGVAEAARHLAELRELLSPDISLMVGGRAARLLGGEGLPPGIQIFESLDAFDRPHTNGKGA
ncbi:MAG: MerR family transcriptional regulator [Gemmatimonadota bacterium]|jgi:DNA-binding transcriptional MerR regulator/methylmalonyl-CoA mutase cobalamin-binding subunit